MQYTHDKEQAAAYSAEALKRMQADGIVPTPDHFELWYVYYAEENPEVVRAINKVLEEHDALSNEQCSEIYEQYLSDARNEEVVRRAGGEIHATLKSMTDVVHNSRVAAEGYSSQLEDAHDQIKTVMDDPIAMEELVSTLAANTQNMANHNKSLTEQLDQSARAMTELQKDLERTRREAMTDGLTGLANRKCFDTEMTRIMEESQESETPFSLLMFDIDHFKAFNDTYGHQVGDQVLRLVGRNLLDGVKGRDIAARYGGEEFAIILPGTGIQAGTIVGDSLRKIIAEKDVINRSTGENYGRVTMSGGVAEYVTGETVESLIERADKALYAAKHAGRNQVLAAE